MRSNTPREIVILGKTLEGRPFRPSDWAERLAGVMSPFRPGGVQRGGHLAYSPWCIPSNRDGVKCVVVKVALRDFDLMAWEFVLNFATDNHLQQIEVD